ncbi:MAG: class I SAM-dependent methyltransferase [Thermoleophilaceae bacterium]
MPSGEPSDPRTFQLLRCTLCASAVTAGEHPGAEAYEHGVYAPGPPRAAVALGALQRLASLQPVAALGKAGLRPGARVLDAGAGQGRLVAALRNRGYEATGIEPSERGAGAARVAGLPVEPETIEEHSDSGLAAVVLWHVLEHLGEPAPALRRVREWLEPGGLLLIGVPNPASLQASVGGPGWLHWDAPRHRLHLTPAGLRSLLRATGFEPIHTEHMVWEHNPAGMWMALLTRAGMAPGLPFHLLKRNARLRVRDAALLAAGVPLAPAAVALELLAAARRRGGTFAMVARAAPRKA